MTLLLGFAAVNTGNNLLYLMVSALLGFMAVSGLLGQRNILHLSAKVMPRDDLFAQLPAHVDIELENCRRWLPAFLISVEIGGNNVLFPLLAAGQKQRQVISLTLPDRGYRPLPPLWIRSCFPINFFVRSRSISSDQQLLVFPQPLAVSVPFNAGDNNSARRREIQQPGIDGELRSIGNYQRSERLKSIHWKLSARHDDYKVKRLSRLGAPSLLLNLDEFSGSLEQRLGQCTFLINQLIRQQRSVGLQVGERLYQPNSGRRQRIKLLTELATYGRR